MTQILIERCRTLALRAISFAVALAALRPAAASAHVKWFAAFDVAGQPRSLREVCSSTLGVLVLISAAALIAACCIEKTSPGAFVQRAMDRVTRGLRSRTEEFIRAGVAAFFVALFVGGQTILTPELKTQAAFVPMLQAAIALGMFWRQTLVLSALGIVVLFCYGIASFGVFHMMDYPIFLGIACCLAMMGLRQNVFGLRPIDVARWGTGITLMWASVEKWAYPQWTFPVLQVHADMTMGWTPDFFMAAAGIVEFALAFGLIWTPLIRRLSAIALSELFIAAVFEFGKVDAIGHFPIIVVLFAIAADQAPVQAVRRPTAHVPAYYCGALIAFVMAYYLTHEFLYGGIIV